jgi:hypothetical protein
MCPQGCDAPQARDQPFSRTRTGGDVRVGRTTLGDTGAPGPQVSLHIGHTPDGERALRRARSGRVLADGAGALGERSLPP